MPKVVNLKGPGRLTNYVYISRGSKWGNPFIINKHGTRNEVIEKYYNYLINNSELMADLSELRGKDLACFCAPLLLS